MSIISHVRLVVEFLESAPERVTTKWADILKVNAERIKEGIDARIPDELAFKKDLADPSIQAYSPYVPAGFISRSGLNAANIRARRSHNLTRAYRKFADNLAKKFETVDGVPAKRFKEEVDLAKPHYAVGVGKSTLGMTGLNREGLGPAAIAAFWLTQDVTVMRFIRAGDKVLEGGPVRITQPQIQPVFKAGLTGRLTQAGVIILQHGFDPTEIAAQNDLTNHIIQSNVDPALGLTPFATAGLSHVDFQQDHGKLYLDVQVNQI
jgi:hypothetical protein